jgi:hypothetical protein
MEFTYQADLSGADKNLILSALICTFLLVAILFLYRNKTLKNDYRNLAMMLSGFIGMISLGVAIFSAWTIIRLRPVMLMQDIFTSPYGSIPTEIIRNTYISSDNPDRGLFQVEASAGTEFLFIELLDGSYHVLSETNYPIREIKIKLDTYTNATTE